MKKLLLLFVLAITINGVKAQWQKTNGPYGGSVNCFATLDTNIYAGGENGLFVSSINGGAWSEVSSDLTGYPITAIAVNGGTIYITDAYLDLFFSTDTGATWTRIYTEPYSTLFSNVTKLFIDGTYAYVVTYDGGVSTFPVLPDGSFGTLLYSGLSSELTNDMYSFGGKLFAGTSTDSLWVSATNGQSWGPQLISTISSINSFASIGSKLYIGTNNGVRLSIDTGLTWTDPDLSLDSHAITSLVASDTNVYAVTAYGIYLSRDMGASWNYVNGALDVYYAPLAAVGQNLFVAGGGVNFSNDGGYTFAKDNNGLHNIVINMLAEVNHTLFALSTETLFASSDEGQTWAQINTPTPNITSMATNSATLAVSSIHGLFFSYNAGISWTQVDNNYVPTVVMSDSVIVCTTDLGNLRISTDNGLSWRYDTLTNAFATSILAITAKGSTIAIATQFDGTFVSYDKGITWANCNSLSSDIRIISLAISDSDIFAATFEYGLYKYSNQSNSWEPVGNLYGGETVYAIATKGNDLYASTYSGVAISYNNGYTWTYMNSGDAPGVTTVICIDSNSIFAATRNDLWRLPLTNFQTCSAYFTLQPDPNTAHLWYALTNATGWAPTYTWNWGDGSTGTGDTASHTYNTPGYYPICLTITDSAGCTAIYCDSATYVYKTDNSVITVEAVSQTATGITPVEQNAASVSIYPNPSSNNFTIETSLTGVQQLQLFDITRRLITTQTITGAKNNISVAGLSPGVYMLSLKSPDGVATRKVVVER